VGLKKRSKQETIIVEEYDEDEKEEGAKSDEKETRRN
jgi:hypothetical protein